MIRSILLVLLCTGAVALGDSPITSTDFFRAYQDVEIVQQARSQRLLDAGMASFLSDSTQRIDVKAALINALSWEAMGQNNTVFYTRFLKERYQVSVDDQLLERLSPHELMCLGYITVMEDYFTPQRALPYLEKAHAARPQSFTIAMIYALVRSQVAMLSNQWCRTWQECESVLKDPTLTVEMRQDGIAMIREYMVLYQSDCENPSGSDSLDASGVETENPCATAKTPEELNRCAQADYDAADAALNDIYQEVLEQLSPAMQEKLKIAQRAWLAFRDANCACQAFEVQGEDIYPAVSYGCLAQMTRQRSQEIWELLAP